MTAARRRALCRSVALVSMAGLAAALIAWPDTAAAQCAMCRRALSDSEAGPLIAALRNGIFFLLAVPIVTFGTITWYAVRGKRRAHEADASDTNPTG